MAQSYLIFDFGSDEEAAEQARRTVDRWKQAFRLDKKVMTKFEREGRDDAVEQAADETGSPRKAESPEADTTAAETSAAENRNKASRGEIGQSQGGPHSNERITLIVRLEFSDHEKLSHRRWLARIPAEEPFKDAQPKTVEHGDPEFTEVMERFQGGAGRAHGFSGSSGTP